MTRSFSDFARRLIALIGTALILAFFSEFYFVNEGPFFSLLAALQDNPLTAVAGFGELIAYYAVFAFPFLAAYSWFRAENRVGLILAGGLYGLAAEATVVPMVYEAPPFSFVWTSLSWHTLVDVVLGWWLLRLAMRSGLLWALGVPILLGGFWGVWATWFWSEPPFTAMSLGEFAAVATFASTGLLLGTWLADRAPASAFRPSWIEVVLVSAILLAFFSMTALPYLPYLPLAILVIAVLALLGLRAQAGRPVLPSLARLDTPPPLHRYLVLALLPAAATTSYGMVLATGVRVPAELVVLPTTLIGGLSFVLALGVAGWSRLRRS